MAIREAPLSTLTCVCMRYSHISIGVACLLLLLLLFSLVVCLGLIIVIAVVAAAAAVLVVVVVGAVLRQPASISVQHFGIFMFRCFFSSISALFVCLAFGPHTSAWLGLYFIYFVRWFCVFSPKI